MTMIMCNELQKADESFVDENLELFYYPCEACKDKDDDTQRDCEECGGEGQHESEVYQYYLVSFPFPQFEIPRLKEYGVNLGYSKLLDLHVLPIYDFGTSWSAFSYSKEVDSDYQLENDETETRQTVY